MNIDTTINNVANERMAHLPAFERAVNRILVALLKKQNMTLADIPDIPYSNLMNRGMTPKQAVAWLMPND